MNDFFRNRSMFNFIAIIFGITLLINLVNLVQKIKGTVSIELYMLFMALGIFLGIYGYIKRDDKILGYSSLAWLLSIVFNLAAIVFVIPIVILNTIGRNKQTQINKKQSDDELIEEAKENINNIK